MVPDLKRGLQECPLRHAAQPDDNSRRAFGGRRVERRAAFRTEDLRSSVSALRNLDIALRLALQRELLHRRHDDAAKRSTRENLAVGAVTDTDPRRLDLGSKRDGTAVTRTVYVHGTQGRRGRDAQCDLTIDMSCGAMGAKRPLGRPLDGGVRPQPAVPHFRTATQSVSIERSRPHGNTDKNAGRRVLREVPSVDGVDRGEQLNRRAIDIAFEDVLHRRASSLEAKLHLLQHEFCLALDGCFDDGAGLGIERGKAGHEDHFATPRDRRGWRLPVLKVG